MSLAAAAPTVAMLRREVAGRLAAAFAAEGREGTPALDARMLVGHAIGRDAADVALVDGRPVDAALRARVLDLADRRIAGEPVARIVGHKEFWGLDLMLAPETLIPRPDTETVVAAALAAIDESGRRNAPLTILDIGTGSGAILLALLSELSAATGVGTDRAFGAVAAASANARRLGLDGRSRFVCCDWAAALDRRFDVILANPPYIESDVIGRLAVEVRDHDPHMALDGGADGLDACRTIVRDLTRLLSPGGQAFLEVGEGQADAVAALAGSSDLVATRHRDIAGMERVVALKTRTKRRRP